MANWFGGQIILTRLPSISRSYRLGDGVSAESLNEMTRFSYGFWKICSLLRTLRCTMFSLRKSANYKLNLG